MQVPLARAPALMAVPSVWRSRATKGTWSLETGRGSLAHHPLLRSDQPMRGPGQPSLQDWFLPSLLETSHSSLQFTQSQGCAELSPTPTQPARNTHSRWERAPLGAREPAPQPFAKVTADQSCFLTRREMC